MIVQADAGRLPLADGSIHAVVTDPPYGLGQCTPQATRECLESWLAGKPYTPRGGGFMGKTWDSWVPSPGTFAEVYRVLKPGAHAVVFASTRTLDLMMISLRLAGFEIRDTIDWLYWSGFPKSLDVSKGLDAAAGVEREVVGYSKWHSPGRKTAWGNGEKYGICQTNGGDGKIKTAPATPLAKQWQGWGTGLKPAHEPAVLARKPLDGTVAANVTQYGTGALNVDGCRYSYGDSAWPGPAEPVGDRAIAGWNDAYVGGKKTKNWPTTDPGARWPANIYVTPKADRQEREAGCADLPAVAGHEAVDRQADTAGLDNPRAGAGRTAGEIHNYHPTVKPVALLRWLVRLVTPPHGLCLDPFVGSGSTVCAGYAEGIRVLGSELASEYLPIARARAMWWQRHRANAVLEAKVEAKDRDSGQLGLF